MTAVIERPPFTVAERRQGNTLLGKAGELAARRIFENVLGGRVFVAASRWDKVDFVGRLPSVLGFIGVQVQCYSFDPRKFPAVGGTTGVAAKKIRALEREQALGGRILMMFPDYVLRACFWAWLDDLLATPVVEDRNGLRVAMPMRHDNFGVEPQLLWAPAWFKEDLRLWTPLTPLEVESMRANRRPKTKDGFARIGKEDEELAAFERFLRDRRLGRSQLPLFPEPES